MSDPSTRPPSDRRPPPPEGSIEAPLPRILWGKLTALSLVSLGLALGVGAFGHASGSAFFFGVAAGLEPIGAVWLLALRIIVVPLVLTQLLAAVAGSPERGLLGRLGGRTVAVIVLLLLATGIASVVVMAPVARLFSVDPNAVAGIRARTPIPESAVDAATAGPASIGGWVEGIARVNVLAAAAAGQILPLLVLALVFGLAISCLAARYRDPLATLLRRLARATLHVVAWILWMTPLAVFALVLRLALHIGLDTLGLLWFYVLIVCGWMLAVTCALYPVSAALGRTSLGTFAKAVAPAQMVAVSTRSSLMSLPALVEGGREHLHLSPSATGFVLPLCTSIFKMSTMTAEPVRYLFLAHLFGVPITLKTSAIFLVTLTFLSFSGVGIPGGGSGFDTLPAFVAAGIPIEGLVLVVAVDTIPDIAKTVINVTGHMSVATLVTRSDRVRGDHVQANPDPAA
ncbi:MAG: dicarboxylate/amino acid:cation symporter [Thermoanaerobaculaceae bacterium]|jgi:Na+/H+-dicarboxylate symporter|nr:dicarboxylate/amino acid:cation symporter [Thermoanaerobaculaceae bacterium]